MEKYKGRTKPEWEAELKTWDGVNKPLAYAARQALNYFEEKEAAFKPTKAELFKMNKAEQVAKLLTLGVSKEEAKLLKTEKARVDKLLSLV